MAYSTDQQTVQLQCVRIVARTSLATVVNHAIALASFSHNIYCQRKRLTRQSACLQHHWSCTSTAPVQVHMVARTSLAQCATPICVNSMYSQQNSDSPKRLSSRGPPPGAIDGRRRLRLPPVNPIRSLSLSSPISQLSSSSGGGSSKSAKFRRLTDRADLRC
jgi:hypothetical protein